MLKHATIPIRHSIIKSSDTIDNNRAIFLTGDQVKISVTRLPHGHVEAVATNKSLGR